MEVGRTIGGCRLHDLAILSISTPPCALLVLGAAGCRKPEGEADAAASVEAAHALEPAYAAEASHAAEPAHEAGAAHAAETTDAVEIEATADLPVAESIGAKAAHGAEPPARIKHVEPVDDPGIDPGVIPAAVKKHKSEIRQCYSKGLIKNPDLEGKVVVEFVISAKGTVASAEILSSDLGSDEVESCIVKAVKKWQFPQAGGGVVKVKYPFVLSAVTD